MTKMQNFKMQGCVAVLVEQNDKLCNFDKRNLPNAILENIKRVHTVCHSLLNECSCQTPESDITDEYIANFRHKLGDLVCNVAMLDIQIKFIRGEK